MGVAETAVSAAEVVLVLAVEVVPAPAVVPAAVMAMM